MPCHREARFAGRGDPAGCHALATLGSFAVPAGGMPRDGETRPDTPPLSRRPASKPAAPAVFASGGGFERSPPRPRRENPCARGGGSYFRPSVFCSSHPEPRPHRLARSRTLPFHGKNRGSNPRGDAILHAPHFVRDAALLLFGLGLSENEEDNRTPSDADVAVSSAQSDASVMRHLKNVGTFPCPSAR